jgi:putative ABC transport system permease protein
MKAMSHILKSTYRNFIRKPVTNLINLIGLAISLALVIILSVYSYSELTTDHYHKKGDRVYLSADLDDNMFMPGILKDQIDLNIPEVESVVRLAEADEAPVFQAGDRDPVTSDIVFADDNFFKLFTYQATEGNLETALEEPLTIVLTKPLAEKLFGQVHALGKTVKLNNDRELTVSAVIDNPQANSCLSFSAITSIATRKIVQPDSGEFTNWGWHNFLTFTLLKKGVKPVETAQKIAGLFPKNEQNPEDHSKLKLTPLKQIYFSKFSLLGGTYLRNGDKSKIMILVMVAALILIIALVNFINISSSQGLDRIKQTGVLKVIGASKSIILKNVLSEAFILFLVSLFLAILIVVVSLPSISNFTGIHFNGQLFYTSSFLIISITGIFILSMVFSLIPALRISSSKAVDNLKKTIEPGPANSLIRGVLVTTQFVIAIVLIAFTILVQKQVNFGNELGFNQENILGIKLTSQLDDKKEVLRKILDEKPSIKEISFTQFFPGKSFSRWWGIEAEADGEKKELGFNTFCADAAFVKMLGLELKSGRFYTNDLSSDKNKVVVNETFIRENKINNPIGAKLVKSASKSYEIIGVVKDFHYKAVNSQIDPLVIRNDPAASVCLVSLQTTDFNSLHKTIQEIKAAVTNLSPSFPVEISFLDQAVAKMYQSELQFRRTFSLFAGCAILICCLGILALSLFASQRRTKEIGIRKVNGATITEVLTMLNRDFVKWVAVAFVISTPIAYYAMHKWLERFAYKTSLSWWIFALAGLLALGIALLTVSWQSWKAATRNPMEALRYE